MLPRGQTPNHQRNILQNVNKFLLQFRDQNDNKRIHITTIHKRIIEPDGTIPQNIMYDFLHLTGRGYVQCFGIILGVIQDILKENGDYCNF